jgi:uncharacterized protein
MTDIPDDAVRESWDSVYKKSVALAQQIETHCRQTGEQFDAMIVVPRGGYYPANIVARELGFSSVNLLHASIGSYVQAGAGKQAEFKVGQLPTADEVRDRNLLVIDEVCDTGQTLAYLKDYLAKSGAGLVRFGVLHYKPERSETGFKPDWVVETTDAWIVYPWEPHEAAGLSSVARRKD